MRIAVIGAGAIGSAVAAGMAKAGKDVTLVARGHRLDLLRSGPLLFERRGHVESVNVKAVAADQLSGVLDLVVCCVKTYDLAEAVAAVAQNVGRESLILTLQNGVEAHERVADCLQGPAVAAGRMHGFFEIRDDRVVHVGVPPSILFGVTRGPNEANRARVMEAFADSGVDVEPTPDIEKQLWQKFMLTGCLGSVALALGVPAGQVCDSAEGDSLLRAAMDEVAALARCRASNLTSADVATTHAFARNFPPDATTSLQRDVEAGRASEYAALTGAVSRIAQRHGFHPIVFPELEAMIAERWPHASDLPSAD